MKSVHTKNLIANCAFNLEVEWEAILQQLPELPGICLDDFLLPLSTDGQPAGLSLLPSFDEDGNNQEALSAMHGDSFGLWLIFLSKILFHDEDFENFPAGEDGGGFIDINSFLGDSCAPRVHATHSADVAGNRVEIEASEDEEIQLSVYVDSGMNGGQFLLWQPAVEKQEAVNGKMGGFTRKRKR
ncbi:hypothetical protein SUGI_0431960 [Cryptomeria japonica]|nr:hypothetical protein SUGI_0431960 [Cryptomeria japonica]